MFLSKEHTKGYYQYDGYFVYMPTQKPQLHGLETAFRRTLNRTPTVVDRTFKNPV